MKRTIFATPYIVWMILFIVAPMLFIVISAFFADGQFTMQYVETAFRDTLYMEVLGRSLLIAVYTTVICLGLGYPIAYFLSTMKKSTASILSLFFIVPMWMNFLLRTYAWQLILSDNGVLNMILDALGLNSVSFLYTTGAVLLGNVYNFLPFMILPIYTVLTKMDQSHLEAAMDLGANRFKTFYKVVLPLSVPGVISGITMVFIPAITTFAISRLLGGGMIRLYGDLIEQKIVTEGNLGVGSVLSIILLALVVISMVIMRRAEKSAGMAEEGGTIW